ncbi:hypothetical protein H4S01_000858 [Coemansia sp. RSA 2610]|nr:hypothetical protein H4S01_000858 [Coemansia sp. RSA 2610]
MYCRWCGEITAQNKCVKCGGQAVPSTTGAPEERKDPWKSSYLQRRLNPTHAGSSTQRPTTSYVAENESRSGIRPRGNSGDYDLPLARPRAVRDATGPRPVSMYAGAGILDAPVQSAIERTVAPKSSSGQLRAGSSPRGGSPRLRSKWSQYFTSTAEAAAGPGGARGRSESAGQAGTRIGELEAGAEAAAAQVRQQQPPRPTVVTESPQYSRLGLGGDAARRASKAHGASPQLAAGPRNVASAFDTRRRGLQHGTSSPLSPSADALRSRSATLPDLHGAGSRACTTCARALRAEEQRQFASQPGTVYCADCYHSSYSKGHCAGCGKIVLTHGRPWVQCGESVWHKLCIKCRTCSRMLITPLVDLDGLPTCEPCFMKVHPREKPRAMSAAAPAAVAPAAVPDAVVKPRAMTQTRVARADSRFAESKFAESRFGDSKFASSSASEHVAASIPTPALTDYDRASDQCVSPYGLDDASRIMSPVEVAEKEGLPLPRHIVDPDLGALARSEPQVTERRSPSPRPGAASTAAVGLGRSLPQPRAVSSGSSSASAALRSRLNPKLAPIDTGAPLSPSLKNPNSPRTASPRSVSFRIDETPAQSRLGQADALEHCHSEEEEEEEEEELARPPVQTRSLADYVLSKASATKPQSTLPSVADTIKKFSGLKLAGSGRPPAAAKANAGRAQLPELHDLIRTHQREPPTDPTIPALDKHSRLLKSRPRNANRRRPSSQVPAAAPPAADPDAQGEAPDAQGEASADHFVPNQCARCTQAIADTWFRLSDGRQVHVECFTCRGCSQVIDDGVYVVEDRVEYHPQCVPPAPPVVAVSPVPSSQSSSRLAKPRGPRDQRVPELCDRCRAVLSGPRFQLTNGKSYHPECFACAGCNQRFDEGSYVCFEGHEYHHQCVEKFARSAADAGGVPPEDEADGAPFSCAECGQLIEGVFLRHNQGVFHPACFCCVDCQRAITPGMPFGEIDARPCCERCLEARVAHSQKQQGWSADSRQYYPAKSGY